MPPSFPHQKLDSYKVAREICLRVYAAKISNAKLRDQAERAATGMFLQLAEGLPITGAGLRKKYFTESLGSLHELVAALDLAAMARFMNANATARQIPAQTASRYTSLRPQNNWSSSSFVHILRIDGGGRIWRSRRHGGRRGRLCRRRGRRPQRRPR
jgi:hypothetical protein